MGKTFRGNDSHGNFRKYQSGKAKGKRKDKFSFPEDKTMKERRSAKNITDADPYYAYDDVPNYYNTR